MPIPAPKPPAGSVDQQAAARGELIFNGKANCASCHVPPLFTEPGWNMHTPVVNHYNSFFNLNLTESEIRDLIEYLKSL